MKQGAPPFQGGGLIEVRANPSPSARVAELADAQDLGSCGVTRPGSTPGSRIKKTRASHSLIEYCRQVLLEAGLALRCSNCLPRFVESRWQWNPIAGESLLDSVMFQLLIDPQAKPRTNPCQKSDAVLAWLGIESKIFFRLFNCD